jgi:hypothetical protein
MQGAGEHTGPVAWPAERAPGPAAAAGARVVCDFCMQHLLRAYVALYHHCLSFRLGWGGVLGHEHRMLSQLPSMLYFGCSQASCSWVVANLDLLVGLSGLVGARVAMFQVKGTAPLWHQVQVWGPNPALRDRRSSGAGAWLRAGAVCGCVCCMAAPGLALAARMGCAGSYTWGFLPYVSIDACMQPEQLRQCHFMHEQRLPMNPRTELGGCCWGRGTAQGAWVALCGLLLQGGWVHQDHAVLLCMLLPRMSMHSCHRTHV